MNHRRTHLVVSAATAMLCLAASAGLAQSVPVPRPAPGAAAPDQPAVRAFDSTHFKDIPYSYGLPKPSFPSSERVQREFVVEYLYDYALSNYTPEVSLPLLPTPQWKQDTPENALIAVFSAMRSGNYDAWIKLWDEPNQKQILADARERKHDAAFWIKLWQQVFAQTKAVVLVDRVETGSQYVILDVRMAGTTLLRVPNTFKLVKAKWVATNDLSNNPILYQFTPDLAGIVNQAPVVDVSTMDHENTLALRAQQHFLTEHTQRNRAIEAGK